MSMKFQNRIPELEHYIASGDKIVYYLQKIIRYDDGYTESFIIGVYNSPHGDIDKAAQNVIRQGKEFCKYNRSAKSHTLTIRKVKAVISSEVIESQSERHDLNHKFRQLECSNCHGQISYGDNIIVKEYDVCDRYFCCNDCLAEYEDAINYLPDNDKYDKLFIEDS